VVHQDQRSLSEGFRSQRDQDLSSILVLLAQPSMLTWGLAVFALTEDRIFTSSITLSKPGIGTQ
jgi:hypothetical protein